MCHALYVMGKASERGALVLGGALLSATLDARRKGGSRRSPHKNAPRRRLSSLRLPAAPNWPLTHTNERHPIRSSFSLPTHTIRPPRRTKSPHEQRARERERLFPVCTPPPRPHHPRSSNQATAPHGGPSVGALTGAVSMWYQGEAFPMGKRRVFAGPGAMASQPKESDFASSRARAPSPRPETPKPRSHHWPPPALSYPHKTQVETNNRRRRSSRSRR